MAGQALRTRPWRALLLALLLALPGLARAADDGPQINAWVVENRRLEDGKHRSMVLPFWHLTTNPDGSTYSYHVLNWISSPGFQTALPLWYRFGEPGRAHSMLVPLWFQGPGYAVAPLALSGSWRRADGGSSLWITPLFHRDRDKDGRGDGMHLLTWLEGDGYRFILPLYYQVGTGGNTHAGLVPVWFSGPGWWAAPLALSAGSTRADGGTSTWVTPLFHVSRDRNGGVDGMHAGLWWRSDDSDGIFPLFWRGGPPEARHHAVLPLWLDGPGWWAAPPLLSAAWRNDQGGRTTWISPLWHRSTNAAGETTSFHVLTWLHRAELDLVLPFGWIAGSPGHRTGAVLPLYFQGESTRVLVPLWFAGRDWWATPALLSAGWRNDQGGRTTWISPLWHRSTNAAGETTSFHVLTWLHRAELDLVLPFGWIAGPPGHRTGAVLPLYFQGENASALVPLWFAGRDWWAAPALLSASWQRRDGGRSTWITPFYHRGTSADGRDRDMHLLTWFSGHREAGADGGHDWQVLAPFWYRSTRGSGETATTAMGLIPFWLQGSTWTAVPAGLSASWKRADGGRSTWITPLYHRTTRADGSTASLHAGPWYQDDQSLPPDPDGKANSVSHRVLFPLWWRRDDVSHGVASRHDALLPLWFSGPTWTVVPPLLSVWSRQPDGATSTWITPLFHLERDRDGHVAGMHALAWIQRGETRVLLPFFFRTGEPGARSYAVVPLWFSDPNGWTVPPALSWHRRWEDGSSTTWITPLAHVSRDPAGTVTSRHILTWFEGDGWHTLFPLWYGSGKPGARTWGVLPGIFAGPDWWAAPVALSGSWKRRDGGRTTWITPLAHVGRGADGTLTDLHVLTWLQGRDWQALLPFWFRSGEPGKRSWGLLPLAAGGPGWWAAPVALSAGWNRAGGGRTTWITPLAHVGRGADGTVTDLHVLNWVQGRDWQALLPFWFRSGEPGRRNWGLLPLAAGGPGWWAAPVALSAGWNRADGGRTTWITPLYHRSTGADGETDSLHAGLWLNGRDYAALLPFAWVSGQPGQRSVGVLPAWISGRDWWTVPALLSGGWRRADGGRSTWITPLAHVGRDAQGAVTDWHVANVIHGGDTTVVAPLAWWGGQGGNRRTVILPLWFQGPEWLVVAPLYWRHQAADGTRTAAVPFWFSGPDWWCSPVGLSAGWRSEGRSTTMITPFYHRTVDADGSTRHMHLLTWMSTPTWDAVAPLWWRWRTAEGGHRTVLAPLWYQHSRADGDFTATAMPLLFSYHRGQTLDTSLAYQLFPFLVQSAPQGSEVNVLWRLFHLRSWRGSTEVEVAPFWYSEHRAGQPASWQVLGGLIGRDCDRGNRTSLSYAAWGLIRFGSRTAYATP